MVGRLLQRCAEDMRRRLGRLTPSAYWKKHGGFQITKEYEKPAGLEWDDDSYRGDAYGSYGWGCDVARKFDVRVHQYDCFNTQRPVCEGGETVFHAECVAEVTKVEEQRPFDTLQNQMRRNGDGANRLVVKIDIEGAEWESLRQAPADVLQRIDQLAIEFHKVEEERFVEVVKKLKQYFYVAHLHFNNGSCIAGAEPFPAWAYEVLFVSRRIGVPDPAGARDGIHPLDARNDANAPDCQGARR